MADHPLRPATHRCLGRPLPYQLANETRAHPRTNAYAEASFTDFVKKPDYPVLAPLSRSYSKSKGRLPTRYSPVRHSTQGRSPFLVRLACVRHAASVHSEPESNSPVTYNYRATLLLIKPYLAFYMLQLAIYLSKILAIPARGNRLYRLPHSPSSAFFKLFQLSFAERSPQRQG